MSNKLAICEGTFIGHAIASNFDPSVHLAFNIGHSLHEKNQFSATDIFKRHLTFYHREKRELGGVVKLIYEKAVLKSSTTSNPTFDLDLPTINALVVDVDSVLKGKTAGCSPAQRSFPLALSCDIPDEDLFERTVEEAQLTHKSPIAGQVAGVLNLIVRKLMNGQNWQDSVSQAFLTPNLDADVRSISLRYHRWPTLNTAAEDAYAPKSLVSALHYVNQVKNPGEAIALAQRNEKTYCTPLTGILAGARWGIPTDLYQNLVHDEQLKMIREVANQLANRWNTKSSINA